MSKGELYRLPEVAIEEIAVEEAELIKEALHNVEIPYRTISGIERDTGIEPAHIASVLNNSGLARRTHWKKEGESVFAASDFPMTKREKVSIFLAILARQTR